jgi:hypothetical protein
METIGVKLHPIKKLQLWQAVKKEVFIKMDSNAITPERADEILGSVRPMIAEADSPEMAKEVYRKLPQTFPELAAVAKKFEIEEGEVLDKMLILLLDVIIDKEGLDLAAELLEKMHESDDREKLANELQERYPIEFQTCLKHFSQPFI